MHHAAPTRAASVVREMMDGHKPGVWLSDRYSAQQGHSLAQQTCLAHLARDVAYALEASDDPVPFRLKIEGGRPLTGALHTVMPDRIELGTVACAAAVTDGEVMLQHARADLLGAAGPVLAAAGVELREVKGGLVARRSLTGLTGTDLQTRP